LQVDAFVRATDSAVASALPRHVGKPVFAAESAAMAVILDANPIVFSSAAQVASKSSSQFRRPTGRALKVGTRMFCPDSLHMAGRIPQRSHYRAIECRAPTPHPIRDGQGGSRPFDANSHFAFQVMLERYGDAERAALKKRLISAVLAGDEPFAIEPNGDRFRRATARVTLRQLQASGAKSATLAAWLAAYDRAERVEGSCV
jgi:hypothetical protein